jgi:hemoglobin
MEYSSRMPAPGSRASRSPPDTIAVLDDSQIYATIGEDGFHRLVALFYRQVPNDAILGPMYPKADLAAAEERLRDFLVGRFGGPTRYIEQRGHPRLRMRHAPFPIDREARDRWMELMTKALDDAHLPPDVTVFLRDFFDAVATMMVNRGDEGR